MTLIGQWVSPEIHAGRHFRSVTLAESLWKLWKSFVFCLGEFGCKNAYRQTATPFRNSGSYKVRVAGGEMLNELQVELRPAPILLPGAAQFPVTLWQQLERQDDETSEHCLRLATYAVAMGHQLRLAESELEALRIGALIPEIGKLAIPAAILQKPAALDAAERAIMQQHTIVGERMCAPIAALRPALAIVRHHHERWDGSGYPDHLAGEAIPLTARIVQLLDIFDALTSARPYKPAWSQLQAIVIMQRETDRGWLDARLFREVSLIVR